MMVGFFPIVDFHFYTLNLEKSVQLILEGLRWTPSVELVKPLPWKKVGKKKERNLNLIIFFFFSLFSFLGFSLPVKERRRQFVLFSGLIGHAAMLSGHNLGKHKT